ncbi:MAG: RNA pyrophosphohydrolase [Pseudomonadota bacterium]
MIDSEGFRANVGIVLVNECGQVFCGRRIGLAAWQFPQGGIQENESPEQAMYRELEEETGLCTAAVEVLGQTDGWLKYRLPKRFIRYHQHPVCIGQKQRWFLLRLCGDERDVCLNGCTEPEFDAWQWVDYWEPLSFVVPFKRGVYQQALEELAQYVAGEIKPR